MPDTTKADILIYNSNIAAPVFQRIGVLGDPSKLDIRSPGNARY
jgi:hypothetical protein